MSQWPRSSLEPGPATLCVPGAADQARSIRHAQVRLRSPMSRAVFSRGLWTAALCPSRCVLGACTWTGQGQKLTVRLWSCWAGPKLRDSPALPTLRSAAGLVKGCAVETNVGILCRCLSQGSRSESGTHRMATPLSGSQVRVGRWPLGDPRALFLPLGGTK